MIKYEDKYQYYVIITSGQFSSLFPNIIKDNNDKFYYLENYILKAITINDGSSKEKDINAQINVKVSNESI